LNIQIPQYWDVIKFALNKVDLVDGANCGGRYVEVFASLLNDKCQCFLRVEEDSSDIKALMITEVSENPYNGQRSLKIICLYAFKNNSNEEWENEFKFILDFARHNSCRDIIYNSGNPRVLALGKKVGFLEKFRTMRYNI